MPSLPTVNIWYNDDAVATSLQPTEQVQVAVNLSDAGQDLVQIAVNRGDDPEHALHKGPAESGEGPVEANTEASTSDCLNVVDMLVKPKAAGGENENELVPWLTLLNLNACTDVLARAGWDTFGALKVG